MILAILGSESFLDWTKFQTFMAVFFAPASIMKIISGGHPGAETMAEFYADRNGIPVEIIKPGVDQSSKIIERCNIVVIFWNGKAGRVLDCLAKAQIYKKPVVRMPV